MLLHDEELGFTSESYRNSDNGIRKRVFSYNVCVIFKRARSWIDASNVVVERYGEVKGYCVSCGGGGGKP